MKINVYFETCDSIWSVKWVFLTLFEKLKEREKDINFRYINSIHLRTEENYKGPGTLLGPHYMILENDETKKYIVISYWDKMYDTVWEGSGTIWDVNNRVELICSSGAHKQDIYYEPVGITYTPSSYVCTNVENEKVIESLYKAKNRKVYPEILSFRGYLYLFRKYLVGDEKFNMISTADECLKPSDYLAELNRSHLNFSINGAGEICNRDMEILGLGTALFRTKLLVKFHNELIPNFHYIAINTDGIPIDKTLPYEVYWKALRERVVDRFEEVKKDHDFIRFVGKNGRKWYEENGTVEANVRILLELINLDKLK